METGLSFHVNLRIRFASGFAQVLPIRIYMYLHEIFHKVYEREYLIVKLKNVNK